MHFFELEDIYDEVFSITLDGGSDQIRVRAGDQFKEIWINQEQGPPVLMSLVNDLAKLQQRMGELPSVWEQPRVAPDELSTAWDERRARQEEALIQDRRSSVIARVHGALQDAVANEAWTAAGPGSTTPSLAAEASLATLRDVISIDGIGLPPVPDEQEELGRYLHDTLALVEQIRGTD